MRSAAKLGIGLFTGLLTVTLALPPRAEAGRASPDTLAVPSALDVPGAIDRHATAVPVHFALTQPQGRACAIDLEFGVDLNRDGVIADGTDAELPSEYRPCTRQRRDRRDTCVSRSRMRYRAGRAAPASQVFVWNCDADLPHDVRVAEQHVLLNRFGFAVPDYEHPSGLQQSTGETGVRLRVRTRSGPRRARVHGDWTYSADFSVMNNTRPELTIASVDTSHGDFAYLTWHVADQDGEDRNDNGRLDRRQGEDRDRDGMLDVAYATTIFEYRVIPPTDPDLLFDDLPDDVDPSTLFLPFDDWRPCMPGIAVGVGDDHVRRPATPNGRSYVYAWNWRAEAVPEGLEVELRARAFDGAELSETVYWTERIRLGE